MKKKRELAASRDPGIEYEIRSSVPPNTMILAVGPEQTEMIRMSLDGFWVRGVQIAPDEKEAEMVYNAFKEFLTYHGLTRSY